MFKICLSIDRMQHTRKFLCFVETQTTQLNQVSQLKKQTVHIYIPKFVGSLKQFKSNN
jgi:hypothetical protein